MIKVIAKNYTEFSQLKIEGEKIRYLKKVVEYFLGGSCEFAVDICLEAAKKQHFILQKHSAVKQLLGKNIFVSKAH